MGLDDRVELLLEQRLAAGRVRLLRRVAARQRARRLLVTAAVVLVAGTGAVATLGADRASSQVAAASVTCFTRADLQADRQVVTLASSTSGSATREDAERACGRVWSREGRAGGRESSGIAAAMCRLLNGSIGVFPVSGATGSEQQLCDHLDLAVVA